MILKTAKFGEVEIQEDLIFDFIEPILGYEHLKKFALVDHKSDSPFKWLQSIEDENIALPVTVPSFFNIDYEFTLPDNETEKLGLEKAEDVLALNVVNVPNGRPQDSTINLIGPIVINVINKKAMQLVLLNTNYSVRHKLFNDDKLIAKIKDQSEETHHDDL
ncbi:MAG: flagellar assembly protein FliW [Candidatus Gastranaerophilaceae bacterium]|jgi:flagellar assembly factor FliW